MVIEFTTRPRKVTSGLLLVCFALLLVRLITTPWIKSLAIPEIPNDPELVRSWRSHPANPQYQHQLLGKIHHYSVAFQDYEQALHQYRLALSYNPLSSRTWVDVARVQLSIGNIEETKRALRTGLRFNPSEARLRWEAALLQIQLESFDEAIDNLRYLVRTDRSKRWSYFALVRTLTTPTDLIETIFPPDREVLSDYLDYLIRHQEAGPAKAVWKRLAKIPGAALDHRLVLSYADSMIAQKEISEAQAAWTVALESKGLKNLGASDNLVWNSGFERDETLGSGFDWTLQSPPGVEVGIDAYNSKEGKRSLRISFDGTQNVDFSGIRQVVRVRPNTRYILGGYIKTRGLTTSSGLRMEAADLLDGRLYGATEGLVGNHDWSELKTSFLTSPRAQAVMVRMRREASEKLDNLVAGTAWIDQVYLKELH